MELGARIKSLRTQRGLSQEALAGQLEVSHQAVAKWESGKSQPSTANLRALCGVFGVSLDALVSGEEPAAPEPPPPAEASPRPRRAAPMVLSAITLLSFSFSVSATIYAGNRHFPEQVIGGAHPGLRAVHPRPSGGGIPPVGYHGGAGASDRPCILAGTETVTSWTCGPGIKKQLGSISPAAFSFTLFYC